LTKARAASSIKPNIPRRYKTGHRNTLKALPLILAVGHNAVGALALSFGLFVVNAGQAHLLAAAVAPNCQYVSMNHPDSLSQ
jgi:hypothetical protein